MVGGWRGGGGGEGGAGLLGGWGGVVGGWGGSGPQWSQVRHVDMQFRPATVTDRWAFLSHA